MVCGASRGALPSSKFTTMVGGVGKVVGGFTMGGEVGIATARPEGAPARGTPHCVQNAHAPTLEAPQAPHADGPTPGPGISSVTSSAPVG